MAESEVLVLPHLLEPPAAPQVRDATDWNSLSDSRLHILLAIHTPKDPHTAVYNNTLARAAYLRDLGHRCTIVAPEDFPSIAQFGSRLTPLTFPIALARFLASPSNHFDAAIFHSHAGWAVSFLRRFLHRHRSLRTAVMFHGLEPLYFARLKREVPLSRRYRMMHGRLMHWLLRASCRNADLVMCLNSDEEQYLVLNEWVRRDRVAVINNPAPESFFVQRQYARRASKLLFVGQWLPMKGIHYLVKAFTELNRQRRELHLNCAGTLISGAEVIRSFPYDIRPHVTVRPRVDNKELLKLHRESDLFVFPTLSEGFSLALAEAMASGLPIVTTQVGAAPDVLRQSHSAMFVPVRNPEAIAASVKRLIDDCPLRERLGRAAQQAAERLRPENNWREYGLCFDRLTAGIRTRQATVANTALSGTTELCRSKS